MTHDALRELLRQQESPKLDFKRTLNLAKRGPQGTEQQLWSEYVRGQWDELIKDVLSLANGNLGYEMSWGDLVVGAADEVGPSGARSMFDTCNLDLTTSQALSKVNFSCAPPLSEIFVEPVHLDGVQLTVISVPPTPHLHESTRELRTTSGEFDATGRLQHFKTSTVYSPCTVFIRRGEGIHPATAHERKALSQAKVESFGQIVHLQNELDRRHARENSWCRCLCCSTGPRFSRPPGPRCGATSSLLFMTREWSYSAWAGLTIRTA